MTGKNKLILIDANNLAYRAYYALPQTIATSTGQITNSAFGFAGMLLKVIEEQKPDMAICAFDSRGPTFRHKIYSDYKATRKKMPDELAEQLPLIKEIAQSLNIAAIEMENYEADDVIASLVKSLKDRFETIMIVSGDKDILQLVSDNTSVIALKKGITETFIYDKQEVKNKLGILPDQIRELLALTGDPSDNIPGASGIGPKTAVELLNRFKNIEEVYRNIGKIDSEKLKNILISQEKAVRTSLELALLRDDLDIRLEEIELLSFHNLDFKKVENMFSILEFSTLKKRLDSIMDFYRNLNTDSIKTGLLPVSDGKSRQENQGKVLKTGQPGREKAAPLRLHVNDTRLPAAAELKGKSIYLLMPAVDSNISTAAAVRVKESQDEKIASFILLSDNLKDYYVFSSRVLSDRTSRKGLKEILESGLITKSGYDFKKIFKFLHSFSIRINGKINDFKIQYLLLNPVKPDTNIIEMLDDVLKPEKEVNQSQDLIPALELVAPEKIRQLHPGIASGSTQMKLSFEAGGDLPETVSDSAYSLAEQEIKHLIGTMVHFNEIDRILAGKIKEEGLEKLYYEIEAPLIRVLADMEFRGVRIDTAYLGELIRQYDADIKELTGTIYRLCDNADFNINSTQQLSRVLFEGLKLSPAKKTKTGYSTDAGTLISIYNSHPVIGKILDYREKVKLKNTYLDVLPNLIDRRDGRVHTTYNQLGTTTGRISSNNPNLQNIPVRTELGRQIRKAFIPGRGYDLLLSADYSQIELRILAHLSDDSDLIEAFRTGFDIHTKTASEIFNIGYEKVDEDLRRKAKAINFGIIYGMTEFGLKSRLSISEEEAREYIKLYFARYPRVRSYINNLISTAYKTGYTLTMFGRKRYIRELASTNANLRSLGERLAVNTPIQGSAADIMKMASVILYDAVKKTGLDCNLILHVHDEIVLELKERDLEAVTCTVRDSMENCVSLKTGLKVDIKAGENWFI